MRHYIRQLFIGLLFVLPTQLMAQRTVGGIVVDDHQEPLVGASVRVKGTQKGAQTDVNGRFSISLEQNENVLTVSCVGFQSKDVRVGNRSNLQINLAEDSKIMDEVVVVGFGTQKKINATGAVKTIGNEMIEARPVTNAVQGLQGVIGGLNITNDQGGALGQEMNINIRGVGTVGDGSNSAPLVLIDGMEGDLATLNPNDIETISVLKDAASASIYGSRAPFGVILVTTKKGERGLRVNYRGNVRFAQPISVPNPVDSYTYALMINDAFTNAGGSDQFSPALLARIRAYQEGRLPYGIEEVPGNDWGWNQRSYGNSDWYDVFLKDYTTSHEHNLSLSGGSDKVNYYFSANYLGQTGLYNYADEKYQRLALNGKVTVKLTDWMQMTWNSRINGTENERPTAMNNLFYHNLGRRSPLMPVYMPNGEFNKESLIPAIKDGGRNINKNQTIANQLIFLITPVKGWNINVELNSRIGHPRGTQQWNKLYYSLPDGSLTPLAVYEGIANNFTVDANGNFRIQPAAGQNAYYKSYGHNNYFNSNIYSDYTKAWGEHHMKVLGGIQTERYYMEQVKMATTDIILDDRPYLNSTSENLLLYENKGKWTNIGFFGRVNYDFANRYLFEFNLRADGASRFPSDKRWGVFPSVSVGWNIAEEPFWESLRNKGWQYLKLRASYGTLGNQNTTSFYPYFQKMNPTAASLVLGNSQASTLAVYSPYTSDLTWERVENAGIGLDFGFFNNRLTGSFDWYQRVTKNMLGPSIQLSAVFGANAPRTNTAELRTRGWELELGWRDNVGKDWSYSINATLSDYNTIITKYDSPNNSLSSWYSGKDYGEIWGYECLGIAKSDREMSEYLAQVSQAQIGNNWGGGDLMYADLDGSGGVDAGSNTLENHGDLKIIGNSTPRFAFSFTLGARWRWIDARAFFQGIGKRDFFFQSSATFFGMVAPWQRSLYTDHLDYFRYAGSALGANMDSYYGRIRTDKNNIQVCDRFLQNAAYLRLKNLQIGFNLPKTTKLAHYLKNARLYIAGENLITWTKLRIYDPEAIGSNASDYGAGKTYPQYRTYSVGLEASF